MVLFSQKCRCKFCKIRLEFPDFDHIDGNSSNNDVSNCVALCPNCHRKRHRKKKVDQRKMKNKWLSFINKIIKRMPWIDQYHSI
ncbi:MAG: HNH endonuclease [Thaumarchaeota archaeon]|nr:HNH endonuclease [Nitrososphaerota archaeon]MCH8975766.1 HNH endonuclease [Nitrososphaerota archaeon]